jgi:UDP-N-acetylmuramate dehydrogenase
MDERQRRDILRLGRKRIHFNCPMAQYTTFRVGGPAEAVYETEHLEGLQRMIIYLNREQIPYVVVGRGSNLLVKDAGLDGLVLILRGSLASVTRDTTDDLSLIGGGGLALSDLLVHCRSFGLGGLEFLAGIPGTVGGAIAMNAGAFGKEIGGRVRGIHTLNAMGDMMARHGSDLNFSYRTLQMETGSVIVASRLRIDLESKETVGARISSYLKRRKETQPIEYPSAGSVFKNPPHDYAGRLIQQAGLKGKKIGGAMISEKHANYIVNTGCATAKDILALMSLAQEKVAAETGIRLEPEVRVIGK